MKNKELENWINKRVMPLWTVEKELRGKLDKFLIDEETLLWLIEDAREEERINKENENQKNYYFGYCRGICWGCKAHSEYLANAIKSKRNRGYGTLKECQQCEKLELLKRPYSELTAEDFEKIEIIKKVV